ncbi:hypothetical protein [Rhizohabitans arisaemae]|uniref:hypothetical protein n=1 Tax=Rhizohabitans arisaemae TaxID=2720610 RepID=UPI0024B072BE|nr:hypothetical protein [Rhizohabitans arisaemae]
MPGLRQAIAAVVVLSVLTGCGRGMTMRDDDKPTITQPQVIARLEELVQQAVAGVEPRPRLELFEPSLTPAHCLDPTDGGSEERLVLSRGYWLRDVPAGRLVEVARKIQRNWESKGYSIRSARGFEEGEPELNGFSTPDEFILAMNKSDDQTLHIGVTSTCFWPNGTPEPSPAEGTGF